MTVAILDLLTVWPPFGTAGAVVEPPPPGSGSFLANLRAKLRAMPGLEEITQVYLTTSPVSAAPPFLIMNRLWNQPTLNNSSSYYQETEMQYDVYAASEPDCGRLGEAALDGLAWDLNDPITFAEGKEMARFPGQSDGPRSEGVASGGAAVWRYRFNYMHLIGKG